MSEQKAVSYRDAGVDIDAADRAIRRARDLIEATYGPECLSGVGSFGGLFRMPVEQFREPVLVSSTDSVGTKVKVAVLAGRHDTLGGDIVNHCVNDILVQGARPLFFLDYVGIGRVEGPVLGDLIAGVARACRENGCALIGGETAEMPDVYAEGEYDLVGTIVGVVERDRILDGSRVRPGDRLIGLRSSGLHTNGYTLARKVVFEHGGLGPDDALPGTGVSVAEALLAVHRSYLGPLRPLLEDGLVSAMAHITGGGLVDNIPRVLPPGTAVEIRAGSWPVPPVFEALASMGPIDREECYRVFNMGVGMALMVPADRSGEVLERLRAGGEEPAEIGLVTEGDGKVRIR